MIVVVGAAAAAFKTPPTDSFSIPGTQSIETLKELQKRVPRPGGHLRQGGHRGTGGRDRLATPKYQAAITESVANLSALDHVTSAVDPITAHDGLAAGQHRVYPRPVRP